MNTKTVLNIIGLVAFSAARTFAAPSVEVTNVQQQYPWTNTVDITYTVSGVKAHPKNSRINITNDTYFATFTATKSDGTTYIPDATSAGNVVFTNALVDGDGTFTARWNPRFNLQETGCTMSPSVFRGEENAYLIINLVTNAQGRYEYWYEPMSTQDASNERYNTDEYKTTKLVMRRVPAGKYTIGDDKVSRNTVHEVTVSRDYYIGVFSVTYAQWARIVQGSAATTGDLTNKRPKDFVSWNDIRGSALIGSTPTTGICALLNERTGLKGFDLPTNAMWEIAMRSGVTTRYFTGNTSAGMYEYAWVTGNAPSGNSLPVGTRKPNYWGIYDFVGNAWNRLLDIDPSGNLATITDAFTPNTTGTAGNYSIRGIRVGFGGINETYFSNLNANAANAQSQNHGFRLSYFAQ